MLAGLHDSAALDASRRALLRPAGTEASGAVANVVRADRERRSELVDAGRPALRSMTQPTSTLLSHRIALMTGRSRVDPLATRIDAGILLAARIEAGLSQRELAARAGTSGARVG
jgi:hypothetical protein